MKSLLGVAVYLFAVFAAPSLLARYLVGGEWRQVGIAYALWFGILFLAFVAPKGGTIEEKLGWVAIFAMLVSIFAVPALTLAQRIVAGVWRLAS
jgi:multidrug transporter EmrE-like cation transporter